MHHGQAPLTTTTGIVCCFSLTPFLARYWLAAPAAFQSPSNLCGIGKARYATTDARKYEDYVVTDTPAPAVVPVPGKA
ncbi:hypothetical protein [Hymenobacter antarcticus]